MSPKNQIIFKVALSNAAVFIVVWLGILVEAWLDVEDEVSIKGATISFYCYKP